jgi:hypothetical protein
MDAEQLMSEYYIRQPSVIICDRGTMDTSAYLPRETWDIVMDEFMWNVVDLRDKYTPNFPLSLSLSHYLLTQSFSFFHSLQSFSLSLLIHSQAEWTLILVI